MLSGSKRATCECWGPVGIEKEHKEEFHAQEKEGMSHGRQESKETNAGRIKMHMVEER